MKLFNVAPKLPEELEFLGKLSSNAWWCWHSQAIELFSKISPSLWKEVESNPKVFLSKVPQNRFDEMLKDSQYMKLLKSIKAEFERDVENSYSLKERHVAYFSMEYGIHESIRLYSGGLGILSGDHLKAASDLKLPMVAVGLLYRQGYFRQYLNRDGWQMERYPENELNNMPMERAHDENGNEITISIPLIDHDLYAAVWVMHVGNIPLVLLDTAVPQNTPYDRELTWRLYGGDKIVRLHQELLLGVGGYKALMALGYDINVCHMNEGHASFLSIARIEDLVSKGYEPNVALEMVWRSNIFTTHTPVPAGNEVFNINLARPYLEVLSRNINIDVDRIIRWGIPIKEREHASEMSMTVLGLRLANYSNGVSKLHGVVARHMWKELWPGRSIDEIPITSITNGVHISSWLSHRIGRLFNQYLSDKYLNCYDYEKLLQDVNAIPDDELWMTHEVCRQSMIRKIRVSMQNKFANDCTTASANVKNLLDPSVLTIGFARRFATYKRGTLLLKNKERLLALLRNTSTPIQFVFAGKAHPADDGGKRLIQELVQFARAEKVQDKFIFVEDYDIGLARHLVQGVDVWLNNPRRPMEASGTSGMKAAINGAPNCSILDGWWDEAYEPETGWAIRGNSNFTNDEDIDNYESQSLFQVLEQEIIPCFYERNESDIPSRWVKKMKASIAMGIAKFSSARMVSEYDEMFYKEANKSYLKLVENNGEKAKQLVAQKVRLEANFPKIYVHEPEVNCDMNKLHAGEKFTAEVRVYLGDLTPEEVKVEAYIGTVDNHDEIIHSFCTIMEKIKDLGNGDYLYKAVLSCQESGRYGITARVSPVGDDWKNSVPGFLAWPK
ncbi:MAG: alpha-glucan family phosphorylase [Lentisphaeria bacterium]|nr:alpha-glucan family phosphorylase [Lentisphaeria bacterium]